MTYVEWARSKKAKLDQHLCSMAGAKLRGLDFGRTGKRLLDAVQLAEVAYGAPIVVKVSQDNGKLKLEVSRPN